MENFRYRGFTFSSLEHKEEDCVKVDYWAEKGEGKHRIGRLISANPYEMWGQEDFKRWADLYNNPNGRGPDPTKPMTLEELWK